MIDRKCYHHCVQVCCYILITTFGTLVFVWGYSGSHLLETHYGSMPLLEPMETDSASRCPGVLRHMTRGGWKTRKLAPDVQKQAQMVRVSLPNLPKSFQRPDGRCGDVGYSSVNSATRKYIRALCNPTGPTPCCFNSTCVNMDEQHCQCKDCVDVRQQIHAEYSTWVPSDDRCKPRQFSSKQSCDLLDGGSVYFVGDSLIRLFYYVFLMTLRGNFKDGALKTNEIKTWKMKCSGMNMFEVHVCHPRFDSSPRDLCGGNVTLIFKEHHFVKTQWPQLLNDVTDNLGKRRSIFVVGVGIHEKYNTSTVQKIYLQPTLNKLQKAGTQWPKFVFVNMGAPGIIKRTHIQNRSDVLRFNQEMERFLKMYDIPVFNTFNMSYGVWSYDGTHYALGLNRLKANVLLSYIQELHDGGQW